VLQASDQVDFCGVFVPSMEARETLGANPAYEGVHWFSKKEEILEDETIVGIAAQGRVSENLAFARGASDVGVARDAAGQDANRSIVFGRSGG
jgi:hypothetical protein